MSDCWKLQATVSKVPRSLVISLGEYWRSVKSFRRNSSLRFVLANVAFCFERTAPCRCDACHAYFRIRACETG